MNRVLATLAIAKQQMPANATMSAHAAVIIVNVEIAIAIVTQVTVANY